MDILSLRRSMQDLRRLREIVTILVEEGFHDHVSRARLTHHARLGARLRRERRNLTPEHIRKTLERLGPTFVKLGQVLSLRPDLIPHEYCEEFRKLQDGVTPIPYAAVRQVIQEDLNAPVEKIFAEFSRKPIASASVGQVHRATLHDGTKVVVKVQRPGIRDMMARDIDIMMYLAKKAEGTHYGRMHPKAVVEEFRTYTERELDFRNELRNTKRMHAAFGEKDGIVIPKPFEEHSSGRVLVLEYIDGIVATDREAMIKAGFDLRKLMHYGSQAILRQVFELRIFHADPHPGNLIALRRGRKQLMAMIDWGIVGYLDENMRDAFLEMIYCLIQHDAGSCAHVLMRISRKGPAFEQQAFEEQVNQVIAQWDPDDLASSKLTTVGYQVAMIALDNDLALPPVFVTVLKALVTMEGAALWMDPHMSTAKEAEPILKRLMGERFGIGGMRKRAAGIIPLADELAKNAPAAAEMLVDKIKEGKLEIHLDGGEFGRLTKDYDLEMQRRNLTILAGMLFVGSALLAGLSPQLLLLGQPLYAWGFIAFATAVFMFGRISLKIRKALTE